MVLTGDMIDSEKALSYGLINSVTTPEDLKETTMKFELSYLHYQRHLRVLDDLFAYHLKYL